MTISAKIVQDSVSRSGIRLTTFLLTYPRIIHSEFMTHRVFSRNASSSRAIPILLMLLAIWRNMAEPVAWGSNKPGMQAGAELKGFRRWAARTLWRLAGSIMVCMAWLLSKTGAHKQIANRIVEPWSHITVVVTATDYANWFALRDHPDADPTIRELAAKMRTAYRNSKPRLLEEGGWHLPFVTQRERDEWSLEECQKVSAARCASTSYNKVGSSQLIGVIDAERIWSKLIDSAPMHASPVEHQATPDPLNLQPHLHGNLRGFIQLRKTLPYEAEPEEDFTCAA